MRSILAALALLIAGPAYALSTLGTPSIAIEQGTAGCRALVVRDLAITNPAASNAYATIGCLNGDGTFRFTTPAANDNSTLAATTAFVAAPYLATGTTTSRSRADRAAQTVDIKDFGGVGNGTATDSPSLISAITALGSLPNKGFVLVPPGTWKLDTSSGFTMGSAGTTTFAAPGAKFTASSGSPGSADYAAGSNMIGFNEGADADTWYFGRRRTGTKAQGVGAFNDGFSPNSFMFDTRADDINLATPGFVNGMQNRHIFGGAAAQGGRQGFYSSLEHSGGATASTNSNRNYVAAQGSTYAYAGDGGTSLSELGSRGQYFGIGGAAYGGSGSGVAATNVKHITGAEFDLFTYTGGSYRLANGVTIGSSRTVRGTYLDSGMTWLAGNQGTTQDVGWKHLMAPSDAGSSSPVAADTTILGAVWVDQAVGFITAANPASVYLANDATRLGYPTAQVNDLVFIGGVTGTGTSSSYNGVYAITAVDLTNRILTTSTNTSAITGTPDFSNATVRVISKRIATGIDLTGFSFSGNPFASPGFTVAGGGAVSATTVTATAAAPAVAAGQVSFGGTTAAASNCGSLAGAAGCLVVNVAGTQRYVPYY